MSKIETGNAAKGSEDDVFAAAEWLDGLSNSSAWAVSPDEIAWQCNTWGSGHGGAGFEDVGTFLLVSELFSLPTGRNRDGRDERIVSVPLERFAEVRQLIVRLGDGPSDWPWYGEDDWEHQVAVAAQVLGLSAGAIADNDDLMWALGLRA